MRHRACGSAGDAAPSHPCTHHLSFLKHKPPRPFPSATSCRMRISRISSCIPRRSRPSVSPCLRERPAFKRSGDREQETGNSRKLRTARETRISRLSSCISRRSRPLCAPAPLRETRISSCIYRRSRPFAFLGSWRETRIYAFHSTFKIHNSKLGGAAAPPCLRASVRTPHSRGQETGNRRQGTAESFARRARPRISRLSSCISRRSRPLCAPAPLRENPHFPASRINA